MIMNNEKNLSLRQELTRVLHIARISNVDVVMNCVREVMGSIPVGDSDFFFVPRSCYCRSFHLSHFQNVPSIGH